MKLIGIIATFLAVVSFACAAAVSSNSDVLVPGKWTLLESGTIDHNINNTNSLNKRTGTPVVTCYNFGTSTIRGVLTTVIDDFCNTRLIGLTAYTGIEYWARYQYGGVSVYVSLEIVGCAPWVVDNQCNVNLRMPVDQCNTDGTDYKQGGYMTDTCAVWRTDPGSISAGSDV